MPAMRTFFLLFYSHKRRTAWLAFIWTALICAACLIPGNEVPDVPVPFADKWVHFIIFAGFSFLWLCTFKRPGFREGLIMACLSALLGYAVELLQGSGITTGRSYDLYDLLADSIGGLIGIAVFFLLHRHARPAP
jgi:VanZ family protein